MQYAFLVAGASGTSLNGRRLSGADVAAIRLSLPCELPADLIEVLSDQPLLGAGVAVTAPVRTGTKCFQQHVLAIYSAERLISEALDYSPGREFVRDGYLAIADGGRRSERAYFVALRWGDAGALYVADPERAEKLTPLGLSLSDLSSRGEASRAIRPRRRLPRKKNHATHAKRRQRVATHENLRFFD